MSLKIVLDTSPDTAYYPGSTISGYLEVIDKKGRSIESLTISLDGHCKVEITEWHHNQETAAPGVVGKNTSDHYRSTGAYFNHSLGLDPGSSLVESESKTWPFRIAVPEYAEQLSEEQIKKQRADTFNKEPPWKGSYGSEPHPLPSSFDYYSGGDFALTASVVYRLRATVTRPKGSHTIFSGNLEAEQKIVIQTSGNPPNSKVPLRFDERIYEATVRSLLLLPNHRDGHLSMSEKASSIFRRSKLPSFSFHIILQLPSAIHLNSPSNDTVPLLIRVARIKSGENVKNSSENPDQEIPVPNVTLRRLRLCLAAITQGRSAGGEWSREHTLPAVTSFDIWDAKLKDVPGKEHFPIVFTEEAIDLGAQLNITMADVTKNKYGRDMSLVPDFSTYNIARTYSLAWKIGLDVVGEEVEWCVAAEDGNALPVRVY